MVRGKCTLGRGVEQSLSPPPPPPPPPPKKNDSVPLFKHIYSSVFSGRQELTLCHYYILQLGEKLEGKLECLGEKLPPSRLNPDVVTMTTVLLHPFFVGSMVRRSSTECKSVLCAFDKGLCCWNILHRLSLIPPHFIQTQFNFITLHMCSGTSVILCHTCPWVGNATTTPKIWKWRLGLRLVLCDAVNWIEGKESSTMVVVNTSQTNFFCNVGIAIGVTCATLYVVVLFTCAHTTHCTADWHHINNTVCYYWVYSWNSASVHRVHTC